MSAAPGFTGGFEDGDGFALPDDGIEGLLVETVGADVSFFLRSGHGSAPETCFL